MPTTPPTIRKRRPGTLSLSLSLGLSGIPQTTQTVLGVYIKRTCSLDTSASSALGVLDDIHALTHSLYTASQFHIGQGLHVPVYSY